MDNMKSNVDRGHKIFNMILNNLKSLKLKGVIKNGIS